MAESTRQTSIVIPGQGESLQDSGIKLSEVDENNIFIAMPTELERIDGMRDVITRRVAEARTIDNKRILFIADSEVPVDFEPKTYGVEDVPLGSQVAWLRNGCRGNVQRILAFAERFCREEPGDSTDMQTIAQYFNASGSEKDVTIFVSEYDRRLREYQGNQEYREAVEALEDVLAPVRGKRIGVDLEGVLVGFNKSFRDKARRYSSYILRVLANEFLQILCKENTVFLCTAASDDLASSAILQAGLVIPPDVEIIGRDKLIAKKASSGKRTEYIKVPSVLLADFMFDDHTKNHVRDAMNLGYADETASFISVSNCDYEVEKIPIDGLLQRRGLLNSAHTLAERITEQSQ